MLVLGVLVFIVALLIAALENGDFPAWTLAVAAEAQNDRVSSDYSQAKTAALLFLSSAYHAEEVVHLRLPRRGPRVVVGACVRSLRCLWFEDRVHDFGSGGKDWA